MPVLYHDVLTISVINNSFFKSDGLGKGAKLSCGVQIAFPVILPHFTVLRTDGRQHPSVDAFRRRAKHNFLRAVLFAQPTKNYRLERVSRCVCWRTCMAAWQVIVSCTADVGSFGTSSEPHRHPRGRPASREIQKPNNLILSHLPPLRLGQSSETPGPNRIPCPKMLSTRKRAILPAAMFETRDRLPETPRTKMASSTIPSVGPSTAAATHIALVL